MAIGLPPWHHTPTGIDPFEIDFSVRQVAIGGKLVQASIELNPIDTMNFKTNDDLKRAIKQKVAAELARAMIESNLIEFTRLPQLGSGTDIIHARCYLAPDNQVKILRIEHADKK